MNFFRALLCIFLLALASPTLAFDTPDIEPISSEDSRTMNKKRPAKKRRKKAYELRSNLQDQSIPLEWSAYIGAQFGWNTGEFAENVESGTLSRVGMRTSLPWQSLADTIHFLRLEFNYYKHSQDSLEASYYGLSFGPEWNISSPFVVEDVHNIVISLMAGVGSLAVASPTVDASTTTSTVSASLGYEVVFNKFSLTPNIAYDIVFDKNQDLTTFNAGIILNWPF